MDIQPTKAPQKRKLAHQRAFLKAFEDSGCIRRAAKAAGITREAHYKWLRDDAYEAAFKESQRAAGDYLESEAVQRATKGWLEPILYQGQVCAHVRRYSDGLLMMLLRAAMPEKYGVQRKEISGPQRTPTQARVEVVIVQPDGTRKPLQ
jgi:hypothetical protein